MPRKTRNTHTIGLAGFSGKSTVQGPNWDASHKTYTVLGSQEDLQDENRHKKGYGDCVHEWTQPVSVVGNSSANYNYPIEPVGFSHIDMGSECYMHFGSTSLWGARQYTGRTDLWSAEAMAYAMYRMQPKIRPTVSILNFLYELKDLKRMLFHWDKNIAFWRVLVEADLNRNFGWEPFLSDIVKMHHALDGLRKNLKDLLKKLGNVEKRHWRFKLAHAGDYKYELVEAPSEEAVVATLFPVDERLHTWEGAFAPPYIHLHRYERVCTLQKDQWANYAMRCSYIAPGLSEDQAQIRALLDYFGCQWDPAIIWNAIPFSFIIDWFVDVGNLLTRMFAKPWYDLYFRVHDVCMGTKVETTGRTRYTWNRTTPGITYASHAITDVAKRYVREALIPTEEDLIKVGFKKLQLKRYVLGAELLVTNTARGKEKRAPRKQRDPAWFYRRLRARRRNNKWLRDGGNRRTGGPDLPHVARGSSGG